MTHHTGSDEGLSEGEREALEMAIHNASVIYSDGPIWRAVERILAARAAAPDALRERVEALASEYDREADAICPRGEYDAKDKAWRVASVRRRVADDLRDALAERPTDGAGT